MNEEIPIANELTTSQKPALEVLEKLGYKKIPSEEENNVEYNQNTAQDKKRSENEGYKQYKMSERIKNIMYMGLIIFIGIVALMAVTGINLFEIFIEIFKTMF